MTYDLLEVRWGDDALFYLVVDGVPKQAWAHDDGVYGGDTDDVYFIIRNTLEAIGSRVSTQRIFDGSGLTYADGDPIDDFDDFTDEMKAALAAHGNDLPITSLPEIKEN